MRRICLLLLLLTGCQPQPVALQPVPIEMPAVESSTPSNAALEGLLARAEAMEQRHMELSATVAVLVKDVASVSGGLAKVESSINSTIIESRAVTLQAIKESEGRIRDDCKLPAQQVPRLEAPVAQDPPPGLLPKEPELPLPTPTEPKAPIPDWLPPSDDSTEPLATESYVDALQKFWANGKPMIVLFSADWCQPCKLVRPWFPRLRRMGNFAYVDIDADRKTTDAVLPEDSSIPTLVVWTRKSGGISQQVYVGVAKIKQYVGISEGDDLPSLQEQAPPSQPGLIPQGFYYPGGNVVRSPRNATLCSYAQQHADYQARVRVQGHQGFSQRFAILSGILGPAEYKEICAESWNWQVRESPTALWHEMFKCWQQSPGHWSVASRQHDAYGSGMAYGSNGVWYACIIAKN